MIRLSPFVVSIAVHAGALGVAAGGHGQRVSDRAGSSTELEIEIDTTPDAPAAEAAKPPEDTQPARARAQAPTHHHDYAVPPSHDARPHDPSVRHMAGAPEPSSAPAPALAAPETERARFVIPAGGSAAVAHAGSASSRSSTPAASPMAASAPRSNETFAESRVSVRARLLRASQVSYPPDAREASVEADVPVEIVVDASGAVVEARSAGKSGHGFDEAAVRAVRGYRFVPALRDGHPVRVRMRWVVHFRLR